MNSASRACLRVKKGFNQGEGLSKHAVVVAIEVHGFGKESSAALAMMVGNKAKSHARLRLAAVAYDGNVDFTEQGSGGINSGIRGGNGRGGGGGAAADPIAPAYRANRLSMAGCGSVAAEGSAWCGSGRAMAGLRRTAGEPC